MMGEWIPISERLPKNSGRYLIWLSDKMNLVYGRNAHMAWWYDSSHTWSFSLNMENEGGKISSVLVSGTCVTHWMPIPKPPEDTP